MAIVGCGQVAAKHIRAIKQLDHLFELIAVCDPDPDTPSRLATLDINCPHLTNTSTLYLQYNPDLVILAGPSGIHPQQTIEAAHHGVHVLTEKPMALTYQDAVEMIQACRDHGVSLFVTQQMRTWPLIQRVRQTLDTDALGEVTSCSVELFWTRSQHYFDEASWRGTHEMDGGTLLNQANHYLDVLVWLFGCPVQVFAQMSTLSREIETDDTCVVYLRWPKMMASLHISMLTYPKNLDNTITLIGQEGTIRIGGPGCSQAQAWLPLTDDLEDVLVAHQNVLQRGGHLPFYEQVANQLGQGQHLPSTDVLDVLRVVEAAQRSNQKGTLENLS